MIGEQEGQRVKQAEVGQMEVREVTIGQEARACDQPAACHELMLIVVERPLHRLREVEDQRAGEGPRCPDYRV